MTAIEPSAVLKSIGLTAYGKAIPLSGGDIGQVWRVDSDQGQVVVKHADTCMIQAEADGLRALRGAGTGLIIPEIIGVLDDVLVTEYLESGRPNPTQLGEGLRQLHGVKGEQHGWSQNNAAGTTRQNNTLSDDGRIFQREQRLLPLGRACLEQGKLDEQDMRNLEHVANTLEEWLPDVPASLLHGDLWSGNVLYSDRGPALIDPAVYRHYPDVDIAMLELFGTPGAAFYEAYWNGQRPEDWTRRRALFQLYPLLNHLLLFGTTYRRAVQQAIAQLR
ncbi:fructosamine kinase family protein [Phytohalomonas tamaricis]|uniref:fructosamine kinase family protein n=1 Tax=Phytohalomonas tamaricis TaxID=2081032 RepID=UPI000D0BD7F1|nr:fructosamine kinase family protein [Phytohalomonas tamaricis]